MIKCVIECNKKIIILNTKSDFENEKNLTRQ